ncbi:FYN-binding protein 1 [Leptodactylus fuscus]|uniref:FYN-binding protein 1 n=1 Tax=Leptodactylus fuscus TaxID=238119 RepID=UPI003F4E4669
MFNAAPSPMEGTEKTPGPPALNSFQARRAEFAKGNNSTPGTFPKKPLQVPKSASDEAKPPVLRPVGINRIGGSIHGASQDSDGKPVFPKPSGFKAFEQQKDEPKAPFPKPIGNKPFMTTNSPQEHKFGVKPPIPSEPKEDQPKPVFPKPSAVKASENESKPYMPKKPPFGAKPSLNTVGSPSEANSNKHGLATKTFSNSTDNKPIKQIKETTEENPAPGPTTPAFLGKPSRPTGIKPLQSPFLKQNTDEPNDRIKPSTLVKEYQPKANHNGANTLPPASKFPRIPSTSQISTASDNLKEQKDSSEPKRRPLATPAQLGPPPQKPARPPNVDLERFRSGKTMGNKVVVSEKKSSALSSALPPPPPQVKSPSGVPAIPSLPPRNVRSTNEDYRNEDGGFVDDISEESDEECYEGIDEHSVQYKREQEEKKEKKRKKELEQAKKEQKEKEKKEQEIRKRFRLTQKIEVIHQAKANTDYKGGKNELSFKHGDEIEIIRVTDNPEGKWLGRMKGNYGYIKTAMVKVDYDSLPRRNPTTHTAVKVENDQDIYDDVGEQDSISNHSLGANSHFPPPPPPDDDIYDGVDDSPPESSVPQEEEKSSSTLWDIFRKRRGTENKKKSDKTEQEDYEEAEGSQGNTTFESDVYDDVDSSDFPPPPIESSLPVIPKPGKSADYKTLKRLEKEEKEFRKKFKFTGDIRVLSSVQVVTNLTAKKWGSKDLPLKPGETLDVIQHANDSTLLCKNSEGKYGYVSRGNIIDNDGDIYDDIGEDCIYDND